MTPHDYQLLAGRTECNQLASQAALANDLSKVRSLHGVLGAMKELGEVAQELERWIYYGQPKVNLRLVAEELGDSLWYVALVCNSLGLDLERIMQTNLSKLKERYPDQWSNGAALRDNRNLEAERVAMEECL